MSNRLDRSLPGKHCSECREFKPWDQFGILRQGSVHLIYRGACKPCSSARSTVWNHANKERMAANKRRLGLKLYGLSEQQYADMLAAQGGVCAICDQDEPSAHGRTGKQFRLSVDHCHVTGRIRGLLCQKCNRAIGLLGDDAELLRKAIEYLEQME